MAVPGDGLFAENELLTEVRASVDSRGGTLLMDDKQRVKAWSLIALGVASIGPLAAACGGGSSQPANTPATATATMGMGQPPPPGYPGAAPPGYPGAPPPGYATAPPPGYAQPAPQPGYAAPGAQPGYGSPGAPPAATAPPPGGSQTPP